MDVTAAARSYAVRRLAVGVLFAAVAVAALREPARANCIAHQPANAQFTPPPGLQMSWDCVTGGPLFEHERAWFIVTFKATNTDQRRVQAMKLQANFVDAFGDVLRTIPIVENARLGTGDSDAAVWAFRPTIDKNSLDHVAFFVIAVKYEDGSLWRSSPPEPRIGPTPAPSAGLRRFAMTGMNYDMGSVIVPPPSPTPFPTSTPSP
ncbi:MAG: hypothetical protein ABSB70_11775 [Candidatus Velthaea sp.]|jgi:hypothetical protein